MGEIINPVQIIVESMMAKRRALMAIPLAQAVELPAGAVEASTGATGSETELTSSAFELGTVSSASIVQDLGHAGSVEEVVAAIVQADLFVAPERAEVLGREIHHLATVTDVQAAREVARELVTNALVPAHQEVLQEDLTERLMPALEQVDEVRITQRGAQLVAEMEGGSMAVEPVSDSDGSVRLNVAADFDDRTCTRKLEQLCDALEQQGVKLSQPRTMPKAPPPEQRLRQRRIQLHRRHMRH